MRFTGLLLLTSFIFFTQNKLDAQVQKTSSKNNEIVKMDNIIIQGNTIRFGDISFDVSSKLGTATTCETVLSKIDFSNYFKNKNIPSNNKLPVSIQSCGDQFNMVENTFALCSKDKKLAPEVIIGSSLAFDACMEKVGQFSSSQQICKVYSLNFIKQQLANSYKPGPTGSGDRKGRGVN